MSFTEQDLAAATHEGAHFAAAVLNGLEVTRCSIDRHANENDRRYGFTETTFRDDDPRLGDTDEMRRVRAIVALAAVHIEPGGPGESDGDIHHAFDYAPAGADPGAWVAARGVDAAQMIRTEIFDRIVSAVSFALLEERLLDAERCAALVREVPGATMATLSARGFE